MSTNKTHKGETETHPKARLIVVVTSGLFESELSNVYIMKKRCVWVFLTGPI